MNLRYSNKLIGFDEEFTFLINLYKKKNYQISYFFQEKKELVNQH